MAERRMFAKSVINSARFLTMPPSSRLLYYDLGMAADDDGVVEAFTVMRTTGAADDDLRVLVSKGDAQRDAIISEFWLGQKPDAKARREAIRALRHPRIRKPLMEYY